MHSVISERISEKVLKLWASTNTWNTLITRITIQFWVNDQRDAQLRYIIRLLLKSSTCFEQLCARYQEAKLY